MKEEETSFKFKCELTIPMCQLNEAFNGVYSVPKPAADDLHAPEVQPKETSHAGEEDGHDAAPLREPLQPWRPPAGGPHHHLVHLRQLYRTGKTNHFRHNIFCQFF
jgi:hypothetical protein